MYDTKRGSRALRRKELIDEAANCFAVIFDTVRTGDLSPDYDEAMQRYSAAHEELTLIQGIPAALILQAVIVAHVETLASIAPVSCFWTGRAGCKRLEKRKP